MNCLILCAIFMIPISIVLSCVIVAIGKRPGYRRRPSSAPYEGVERRCAHAHECQNFKPVCDQPCGVNTETDKEQ